MNYVIIYFIDRQGILIWEKNFIIWEFTYIFQSVKITCLHFLYTNFVKDLVYAMMGHVLPGGWTTGTHALSHAEAKEYKRVMWNVFTWLQKNSVKDAWIQRSL